MLAIRSMFAAARSLARAAAKSALPRASSAAFRNAVTSGLCRLAKARQNLDQRRDRYPLLARQGLSHRPLGRIQRLQPFHFLSMTRCRACHFLLLPEINVAGIKAY